MYHARGRTACRLPQRHILLTGYDLTAAAGGRESGPIIFPRRLVRLHKRARDIALGIGHNAFLLGGEFLFR